MRESTVKPSSGSARSSEVARALIRRTKQASRRRSPAEEKIRILLEGIRAEISVAELYRREGIHPTVYYAIACGTPRRWRCATSGRRMSGSSSSSPS